jgi:hypothetical protein
VPTEAVLALETLLAVVVVVSVLAMLMMVVVVVLPLFKMVVLFLGLGHTTIGQMDTGLESKMPSF